MYHLLKKGYQYDAYNNWFVIQKSTWFSAGNNQTVLINSHWSYKESKISMNCRHFSFSGVVSRFLKETRNLPEAVTENVKWKRYDVSKIFSLLFIQCWIKHKTQEASMITFVNKVALLVSALKCQDTYGRNVSVDQRGPQAGKNVVILPTQNVISVGKSYFIISHILVEHFAITCKGKPFFCELSFLRYLYFQPDFLVM